MLDILRVIAVVYYNGFKIGMNFAWMLGIHWWITDRLNNFGILMLTLSLLYMLSNVVYFLPDNVKSIVNDQR